MEKIENIHRKNKVLNTMIQIRISVGDTIVYVIDYNYTDADFLNFIKDN